MRDGPLDEQYLQWLYAKTGPVTLKNPSQTYWTLLKLLYRIQFSWLIPTDANRGEDGRGLRYLFLDECHIRNDEDWLGLECSVLEMLIALADRLSFEAGREPESWFWELIENLDLTEYTDRSFFSYDQEVDIESKVEVFLKRTYTYSGRGGLFPLEDPREDQRDVEIWYQMGAYLLEREERGG